jgi:hypothetical protein
MLTDIVSLWALMLHGRVPGYETCTAFRKEDKASLSGEIKLARDAIQDTVMNIEMNLPPVSGKWSIS